MHRQSRKFVTRHMVYVMYVSEVALRGTIQRIIILGHGQTERIRKERYSCIVCRVYDANRMPRGRIDNLYRLFNTGLK
jgi:hypothetical protein